MRVWVWLVMLMVFGQAESRVALLIGNSSYDEKHLVNPGNDVDLLAAKLKELNFAVIKKKNLNKSETLKALKRFYRQIDNETIALIYFSGHGVHSTIDNKNYLIPIGAFESLVNEEDLSNEAISDGKLLASTSGAKFSILLLDACRSNDFAKVRGDKGLGQPKSKLSNDYVISYATEVGKTANDGNGNSPYALALAEYLSKGYSIGDIFTKVRARVSKETRGKQKPYYAPHFENILYLSKSSPRQKTHDMKNITTIGNLMWQDESYTKEERYYHKPGPIKPIDPDNMPPKAKEYGKALYWENCAQYCTNLQLGDYNDWRLPSVEEFKKLYKYKNKLKNIENDRFDFATNSKDYKFIIWGLSPDNIFPLNVVDIDNNPAPPGGLFYVRCVREVQ